MKVGDKVRVIKNKVTSSDSILGEEGIIVKIDKTDSEYLPIEVYLENDGVYPFDEEELEVLE